MEELQKSRAAWNECKGGKGEEGLKGRWRERECVVVVSAVILMQCKDCLHSFLCSILDVTAEHVHSGYDPDVS